MSKQSGATKFKKARPRLFIFFIALIAIFVSASTQTGAIEPEEVLKPAIFRKKHAHHALHYPNIPFRTLGGKQFWGDVYIYAGWRIQRNIFTGHHRLLDDSDIRRAWGDYAHCRNMFNRYKKETDIQPLSRHLVLIIPGILRSKDMLAKMENRLQKEGFEARAINYPSSRGSLADHTRQLKLLISRLEDIDRLSFVTHSMGGIIVRKILEKNNIKNLPSLNRLVMIAPPNQGSTVAKKLGWLFPYKLITGQSGQQLKPDKIKQLPVPELEFGIIAGHTDGGFNFRFLLPEKNDGTVTVSSTRLRGARDFILLEGSHNSLPRQDNVIEKTINFLKSGSFN